MALVLLQLTTKNVKYIIPETWQSIYNLDPGSHIIDLHMLCCNKPNEANLYPAIHCGYNLERSREFAVKHGYDYMFIVQSDIIFPPNTLLVLLDTMKNCDAGVVCPLTPERPESVGTDDFVVCMPWNGNPDARTYINEGKNFRITGNGSGYMCALVRKDVFTNFQFTAEGCSDITWYQTLQKANIKIICEVSLRLFHKQYSDSRIIRDNEYVIQHWRETIENDERNGRAWHHSLSRDWWWGKTKEQFFEELPKRIDEYRLWCW